MGIMLSFHGVVAKNLWHMVDAQFRFSRQKQSITLLPSLSRVNHSWTRVQRRCQERLEKLTPQLCVSWFLAAILVHKTPGGNGAGMKMTGYCLGESVFPPVHPQTTVPPCDSLLSFHSHFPPLNKRRYSSVANFALCYRKSEITLFCGLKGRAF